MSGSKAYKESTSSPIASIAFAFTENFLDNKAADKVKNYVLEMQTGKTPPMNNPKYYSSKEIDWVKPSDIGISKYLNEAKDKLSQIAIDENKVRTTS